MAYNTFTLKQVIEDFKIEIEILENAIFAESLPSVSPSEVLKSLLDYNVPLALAISTEKARSEFIIAPILTEVKKRSENNISLFSGIDFTVDASKGLKGRCDFIISSDKNQLLLTAPIITLVEAKNDNINSGLGQCIAEMIAAQIFNQEENQESTIIYGVITTGSNWKFLKLIDKIVYIESKEFYIENIDVILGILLEMTKVKI